MTQKRDIFAEAILTIIILQVLLMLLETIAASLIPDTSFAERMAAMTAMVVRSGIAVLYAELKKTRLSVFPVRFSKFCIISAVCGYGRNRNSSSNYAGGSAAIL
jgi:hypothetical protein